MCIHSGRAPLKGVLALTYSFGVWYIIVEKSWRKECGVTGPMASSVGKQGEMNANAPLTFSSSFSPEPTPMG